MSLHVIAYDISDDRRRRKVHRWLRRWGERVQYSVFEAHLDSRDLDEVLSGLAEILEEQDECTIAPVDEGKKRGRLRWRRAPENWQSSVEL